MTKRQTDNTLRLLNKFTIGDGCWEWTYAVASSGYGRDNKKWAHRAVYEEFVGTIPVGLQLDHTCRNRKCVRPSHLEPVTPGENVRRGWGVGGPSASDPQYTGPRRSTLLSSRTHCDAGHEFTKANTRWRKDGKGRQCRKCDAGYSAAGRLRRNTK
jgi:hypothetical protein